jgi:hypothetical protein
MIFISSTERSQAPMNPFACSSTSHSDLSDCIADAEKGLLSPYWQVYAKREVQSFLREDGTLPPDITQAAAKLQHLLATVPQISDHEQIRQEVEARGDELLYDYHGVDPDTFIILIYVPQKKVYTASLAIADAPKLEQRLETQVMCADLLYWCQNNGFEPDKLKAMLAFEHIMISVRRYHRPFTQEYYTSKEDAVRSLLSSIASILWGVPFGNID